MGKWGKLEGPQRTPSLPDLSKLKYSPKMKVFRGRISWLVEAPRVGREKLPPGEITKEPIQRHKAILAPVSCPEQLGPCGTWGSSREVVADGVPVKGTPDDLWIPAGCDGCSRGL